MIKKEVAAYAAGLFDGEGSVDIYNATPAKASKSPSFMLRVTIAQKDGKVMYWLKENFGGYVGIDRHRKYFIHRWDIRSQKAVVFLRIIAPFVIIKKPQVELAMEFEEQKGKYLRTLGGKRGFRQLSEAEIKSRYEMKEKLKKLKREYVIYTLNTGTATTTKREEILKGIMQ